MPKSLKNSQKVSPNSDSTSREDAFEIIELATSDLQTLTKAFDLISEVCSEYKQPHLAVTSEPEYPVQ
ncbi:MAG: hypothetical protein KDD60_02695 [Bdellovibrionales bacterium]|nr:hypothetical protein [Bdellovibrionales bacterium]